MPKLKNKKSPKSKNSIIYKIIGNGPNINRKPLKVTATFTLLPDGHESTQNTTHLNSIANDIDDALDSMFDNTGEYNIAESGGTIKIEIVK